MDEENKKQSDSDRILSQVFLRNIPLDYGETQIEELVESYGPIRRIDLIRYVDENGKKVSKGMAFVRFAIVHDAENAIKDLNGKTVDGNILVAKTAFKKGTKPLPKVEEKSTQEKKDIKTIWPERLRTALIFGVSPDLSEKKLRVRIRKLAKIEKLEIEVRNDPKITRPKGNIARVICMENSGVSTLITGLDGHIVHDYRVYVRRADEVSRADEFRKLKRHRLALRNLPSNTTNETLDKIFEDIGPIKAISIYKDNSNVNQQLRSEKAKASMKPLRCASVQFLCSRDAEKVLRKANSFKIDDNVIQISLEFPTTESTKMSKLDPLTDRNPIAGHSAVSATSEDGPNPAATASHIVDKKVNSSDTASNSSYSSDASETEKKNIKEKKSDVQFGQTIFVRNVPYDATEESLKECFERFGEVRLAVLVKDRESGMPKGTAFVKFSSRQEAESCLSSSAQIEEGEKKSIFDADGIFLNGRQLNVIRAVEKDDAQQFQSNQSKSSQKDKRYIYLANEGMLVESDEAAKDTPASEMKKRAAARYDKKQKLKSPLFFISPLRLSVKNLKKNITDSALHDLFLSATREGLEQEKATLADLQRFYEASGEKMLSFSKKLTIPQVTKKSIPKVKIFREVDKNGVVKKGMFGCPSRGYGFITFTNHAHALAALRMVNNNPKYSYAANTSNLKKGEIPRLIVEFAVENHRKIQLQESRISKLKVRTGEMKRLGLSVTGVPIQSDAASKQKEGRGKRQRESKRLKKLESGNNAVENDRAENVPASKQPPLRGHPMQQFHPIRNMLESPAKSLPRGINLPRQKSTTQRQSKRPRYSEEERQRTSLEHNYIKRFKLANEGETISPMVPPNTVATRWFE